LATLPFDLYTPFRSRVPAIAMASRGPARALWSTVTASFAMGRRPSASIDSPRDFGYGIWPESVGIECHAFSKLLIQLQFTYSVFPS
jgi:hypothetical protein